jgi:hypothetical protein
MRFIGATICIFNNKLQKISFKNSFIWKSEKRSKKDLQSFCKVILLTPIYVLTPKWYHYQIVFFQQISKALLKHHWYFVTCSVTYVMITNVYYVHLVAFKVAISIANLQFLIWYIYTCPGSIETCFSQRVEWELQFLLYTLLSFLQYSKKRLMEEKEFKSSLKNKI